LNAIYRQRREKVFELLELLKCKFSNNQAGLFVWARASSFSALAKQRKHPLGAGGAMSDEVLGKCNVFITPGGIFGRAGENYLRVSLCATVEKLEEAKQRIIQNLNQ
jgi:aspartate/methionine/tyrosine aminotransferase